MSKKDSSGRVDRWEGSPVHSACAVAGFVGSKHQINQNRVLLVDEILPVNAPAKLSSSFEGLGSAAPSGSIKLAPHDQGSGRLRGVRRNLRHSSGTAVAEGSGTTCRPRFLISSRVEIAMVGVVGSVLPCPDIHPLTLRDRGLGKSHAKATDTSFRTV